MKKVKPLTRAQALRGVSGGHRARGVREVNRAINEARAKGLSVATATIQNRTVLLRVQ